MTNLYGLEPILLQIEQHTGQRFSAKRLENGVSLNNRLYHLRGNQFDGVLRVPAAGRDRTFEIAALKLASENGIAPKVFWSDSVGNVLLEHVQGRHWTKQEAQSATYMRRLGSLISNLHSLTPPADGKSLRQIVDELLRQTTPSAVPDELAELVSTLPHDLFGNKLTHHDIWLNNLLDDGERLLLIDFEFAGIGDGLYDLATASMAGALCPELEATLLEAYRFNVDLGEAKRRVMIFEAAWSFSQHVRVGSEGYNYHEHSVRAVENARRLA